MPFCAEGVVFGLLDWFRSDRTHPEGGPNLTDPSRPVGHVDYWPLCRKATAETRVRALTVGVDGCVYGLSGEPEGMAHLFRYDPEAHDLRDLGIPLATVQRHWHGYEFDAACTGKWGEISLGESDRMSHLFIYFPPLRRRSEPSHGDGEE